MYWEKPDCSMLCTMRGSHEEGIDYNQFAFRVISDVLLQLLNQSVIQLRALKSKVKPSGRGGILQFFRCFDQSIITFPNTLLRILQAAI